MGGDFYDFVPLTDDRMGSVMGDVSGKGVPAAVLMASTQSVLRALAQRGSLSPSRQLADANEVLSTYNTAQHVRHLLLRHPSARSGSIFGNG